MIENILKDAQEKMDKAIEVTREDFLTVRAGRASAALFSKVMVEYYGTMTPIMQVASIQVPEARTAVVTPFDKSALFAGISYGLISIDIVHDLESKEVKAFPKIAY